MEVNSNNASGTRKRPCNICHTVACNTYPHYQKLTVTLAQ